MESNWEKYFKSLIDKSYSKKEGVIICENWCCGGSWGDCWGNSGEISPEPPPTTCKVLDDLLMEVSPDISFLKYRELYNKCVSIEEYSESDYYGGVTYYQRFVLDVKGCYEWLLENKIIEK